MTFEIKRPKEKEIKSSFAVENKKEDKKKIFLEELKNKKELTEKDVLLIKRRLNNGTYTNQDLQELFKEGSLKLTKEQQEKGRLWLIDKWKSPKGLERKNNPFGYREENALDTFKRIDLQDFYDNVNYDQAQLGIHNYQPYYRVIGKDTIFGYYISGGEVIIQ